MRWRLAALSWTTEAVPALDISRRSCGDVSRGALWAFDGLDDHPAGVPPATLYGRLQTGPPACLNCMAAPCPQPKRRDQLRRSDGQRAVTVGTAAEPRSLGKECFAALAPVSIISDRGNADAYRGAPLPGRKSWADDHPDVLKRK
jgi:hypothetical protein